MTTASPTTIAIPTTTSSSSAPPAPPVPQVPQASQGSQSTTSLIPRSTQRAILEPPYQHTPPTEPSLPHPSSFDTLPQIHALLSRLVPLLADHPPLNTTTTNTNTSTSISTTTSTSTITTGTISPFHPLEPQHINSEATSIRVRLQRAQAAIQSLPDITRSVAEQRQELSEVEGRLKLSDGTLHAVRERARAALVGS